MNNDIIKYDYLTGNWFTVTASAVFFGLFFYILKKEFKKINNHESFDIEEINFFITNILNKHFFYTDVRIFDNSFDFLNNEDLFFFISKYFIDVDNIDYILNNCNKDVQFELKNFIKFLFTKPNFAEFRNYDISSKALAQLINTIKFFEGVKKN